MRRPEGWRSKRKAERNKHAGACPIVRARGCYQRVWLLHTPKAPGLINFVGQVSVIQLRMVQGSAIVLHGH